MTSDTARIWAVVPAAGKGSRMGADRPKQYLELAGRTVLEHTLRCLLAEPRIAGIVVPFAPDDVDGPRIAASLGPRVIATLGGAERCHSVLNGLDALPAAAADDWALVHDAARPCLRAGDLAKLIEQLAGDRCGGILAVPVRDTLKRCAPDGAIEHTVDRNQLWHALTPQMFRLSVLRDALRAALAAQRLVTDEAQAVELAGFVPRVVEGHADNIKITRPEDLPLADYYLRNQAGD